MRLIDADVLLELIKDPDNWRYGYLDADDIQNAPTVDVAEVRHGKWITPHWCNSTSCANCSECGFEAQHSDYRGVQEYYKLCPSCGAKMDEMEEEK